jgi:hypothetical protein
MPDDSESESALIEWEFFMDEKEQDRILEQCKDVILAAWAQKRPGRRPAWWWCRYAPDSSIRGDEWNFESQVCLVSKSHGILPTKIYRDKFPILPPFSSSCNSYTSVWRTGFSRHLSGSVRRVRR